MKTLQTLFIKQSLRTPFLCNQGQLIYNQRAFIYIKDKDLDKNKYKASEADYVKQYVSNYMKDDPKQLSEQEKQKLIKEAEMFAKQQAAEQQQQNLKQQSSQTEQDGQNQNEQREDTVKVIQPDQIKTIFDKLTEIDTNPQGKSAQEFFKKVEEIEKQQTNKKKSQIIIKTLKRGKNVQNIQYDMTGGIGKQITEQQIQFEKKYIDFTKDKFPEREPFIIQENGKNIRLESYRYPANDQKNKRGIIFYAHGYGDYVGRYAYFAKYFAEAGYDFVGIDQRGFGLSEGRRAIIENEEIIINDQLRYVEHIDSRYGGKNVSKHLLGYSLGSLLTSKMCVERPKLFNSMGIMAPYIQLKNKELIDKYLGLAKFVDKIFPTYKLAAFPVKKEDQPKDHYKHFLTDPLCEFLRIPVHNIVMNHQIQSRFVEKVQDNLKTPLIMIIGGQDNIISNKAAKDFFEMIPIQDKAIVNYDDLDHMIIHDREYVSLIAKDLISFYNTH